MLNYLLFSVVFCAVVIGTHGYTAEEVEDLVRDAHNHAFKKVSLPDSNNETVLYIPVDPTLEPIEAKLFLQEGWLIGLPNGILNGAVSELTSGRFQIPIYFNNLTIDYKYSVVVGVPINTGRGYSNIMGFRAVMTVYAIGNTFYLGEVDSYGYDLLVGSFYASELSPVLDIITNEAQKPFRDMLAELIRKRYARIFCNHMVDMITAAAIV